MLNAFHNHLLMFLFFNTILLGITQAQIITTLNADGPDSTYELIEKVLGPSSASEVPDCYHQVKHIREVWDSILNKYVFAFDIHVENIIDNDRCINYDRQRNEIKTVAPETITAQPGEYHIYKWKFKIDSLFKPSPNFCHLHQIKATGGNDDDMPLMTITPRSYSNNTQWLQLIYSKSSNIQSQVLTQVRLEPLKGIWLDVTEKIIYSDEGKYEISIRKLDGTTVFHYADYLIDMYRAGANFHRAKWGIYRSLNSIKYLRDETVKFSDFVIIEGEQNTVPEAPTNLNVNRISDNQIKLTWSDNSSNETNFLIQRSLNGIDWITIAAVNSNVTEYLDVNVLQGEKYYYRVKAENWNKSSEYTIGGELTNVSVHDNEFLASFNLWQNYPNPFNPTTNITFSIPQTGNVKLKIYDPNGKEIYTLADKIYTAGIHNIKFNGRDIPSGVYFIRLQYGTLTLTKKMLLIK